jgi:hypothetical protein
MDNPALRRGWRCGVRLQRRYFFLLLDLRLPLLDLRLRLELLFFELLPFLRLPFVSPDSRRCLLTVRAAISFARFVLRPSFFSESLMCSYCRLRFALFTPRGGIAYTSISRPSNIRARATIQGCCSDPVAQW